jgi:hypothetical protein
MERSIRLARSDQWSDRVQAGRELSQFAGEAPADSALLALLGDTKDTGVVSETSDALLSQYHAVAWRIFAISLDSATAEQGDQLVSSLSKALYEASQNQQKATRLEQALLTLLSDDNEPVRRWAREMKVRLSNSP